jgi:hypothetical protein
MKSGGSPKCKRSYQIFDIVKQTHGHHHCYYYYYYYYCIEEKPTMVTKAG